jgi:hypothetical protein
VTVFTAGVWAKFLNEIAGTDLKACAVHAIARRTGIPLRREGNRRGYTLPDLLAAAKADRARLGK